MKKIVYISNFFSEDIKERNSKGNLASNAKMKYIVNALNNATDNKVVLLSPGLGSKKGYSPSKTIYDKNGFVKHYLPLLRFSKGKTSFGLSATLFSNFFLFLWIIKHIKKNDTVVVYSAPWINPIMILLRLIIKFNMCLEIEELYYTNSNLSKFKKLIYILIEKVSINISDSFILACEDIKLLLNRTISKSNFAVCYGDYQTIFCDSEKINEKLTEIPFLLYSGSIDVERGVFVFLESLNYLQLEKFRVIITGYGKQFDLNRLSKKITELQLDGINIQYLGALEENEYNEVLSKSIICISPQVVANSFSSASFPSKIIKYISHGNFVVASDMSTVKKTNIATYINFYSNDDPKELAEQIKKVLNKLKTETVSLLRKEVEQRMKVPSDLEQEFIIQLRHLLK